MARIIKHPPVTRLGMVTLAYAATNFLIYGVWRNKPPNANIECSGVPKTGSEIYR